MPFQLSQPGTPSLCPLIGVFRPLMFTDMVRFKSISLLFVFHLSHLSSLFLLFLRAFGLTFYDSILSYSCLLTLSLCWAILGLFAGLSHTPYLITICFQVIHYFMYRITLKSVFPFLSFFLCAIVVMHFSCADYKITTHYYFLNSQLSF